MGACGTEQAGRVTFHRLTPRRGRTYDPADDERATPLIRATGAFACLLGSMTDGTPRQNEEDPGQAR